MKIVKVTIDDATGEFDVNPEGFHGKECDTIIADLGGDGIKTVTVKPEYNERVNNQAIQRVR